MLNSLSDGDEVRALVNEYRRACVKRGEEPGTIGVIRRGWFGGGEEGQSFLRTFERQLRGAVNFAEYQRKPWVRDLASRRWVQDVAFTGEPEELAAALSAWCERVGVDYVMLKLHWGARDFGQLTEQLRRAERFTRALGR